jgi:hypothetical protein
VPTLAGDRIDQEEAWRMFMLMEATQWRHLPSQLQEQDELLMGNISLILAAINRVRYPDNG